MFSEEEGTLELGDRGDTEGEGEDDGDEADAWGEGSGRAMMSGDVLHVVLDSKEATLEFWVNGVPRRQFWKSTLRKCPYIYSYICMYSYIHYIYIYIYIIYTIYIHTHTHTYL